MMLSRLSVAILATASVVHGFAATNHNEDDPVYCLADTPAISWPSTALPNIEHVDLAATVTLTPVSATRTLVAVRTPEPYARATLRIDWPGTFPNLATFVEEEDCGFQAAGISNRQADVLIGMMETSLENSLPFETENLELDLTVVLAREQDMFGETAIVYAYEHITVEPWMWASEGATVASEEGWAVSLLPNGALEMELVSRSSGMHMAMPQQGGLQVGDRAPFPGLDNSWGAAAFSGSFAAPPETPPPEPPVEEFTTAAGTGGGWNLAGSTWITSPTEPTTTTTASSTVQGDGWAFVTTNEALPSAGSSSALFGGFVVLLSSAIAALAMIN